MRLYPAFRFEQGGREFFVTKMNASEIVESVHFASDVFQGRTLSEAIQRTLREDRASKDIAFYWRENEARFFNSIVIAAWGGNARFRPIESLVSGEPFLDDLIANDRRMRSSFGILAFDGTETYYALDGQHRVRAIQLMVEQPGDYPQPPGFRNDEFTVIIVPTAEDEHEDSFRVRYRRMFSALNRYAKPTDQATNIIMDEDDIFAIITRRLITDHPFFRWGESDWENERVKTEAGKNLQSGQSWFTQIEILYEMTERLLTSALRENSILADKRSTKFKQVRPTEALIESWYDEVSLIWTILVNVVPHLSAEPSRMRTHNPSPDDHDKADHLWFWPIGQQMVVRVVRMLLDRFAVPVDATIDSPLDQSAAQAALTVLGRIDWDLHALPWRYLLLVRDDQGWRMRSEGRTQAVKVAEEILLWLCGLLELGDDGLKQLRQRWEYALYLPNEPVDELWTEIERIRLSALGERL